MKKPKHSKPTGVERFARVPLFVIECPAYGSLPYPAIAVLVAITSQCKGRTSGELALTWGMARKLGIRSHGVLVRSLATLLERGLIIKTKQGGKRPAGPTLYALGWLPIHARSGGYDFGIVPTVVAANAFLTWTAPAVHRPARGDNLKRRRPGKGAANGPARGSNRAGNGTARGPVNGSSYSPVDQGLGTAGSPGNGTARGAQTAQQRDRTGDDTGPRTVPTTPFNGSSYGPTPPKKGDLTGPRTVRLLDLRDSVSALERDDDAATVDADDLGPPPW